MYSLKHVLSLTLSIAVLWLLLSGHFTPLFYFLDAISVALVVYLALRMEVIDHESHPVDITPRLLGYWLWLALQVVRSNLAVAACVLRGNASISPTVARVPTQQRTDIGRTIFANSITLTPGTVSLTVDEHEIEVHALTEAGVRELQAGEMTRRVPESRSAH